MNFVQQPEHLRQKVIFYTVQAPCVITVKRFIVFQESDRIWGP